MVFNCFKSVVKSKGTVDSCMVLVSLKEILILFYVKCSVSSRWRAIGLLWHSVYLLTDSFLVHLLVQIVVCTMNEKLKPTFCSVLFFEHDTTDFHEYIKTCSTSIYNSSGLYVVIFCGIRLLEEIKTEQNEGHRFCTYLIFNHVRMSQFGSPGNRTPHVHVCVLHHQNEEGMSSKYCSDINSFITKRWCSIFLKAFKASQVIVVLT